MNLDRIHPNLWLGNVHMARASRADAIVCTAGKSTCAYEPLKQSTTLSKFIIKDTKDMSYETFMNHMRSIAHQMHTDLEKKRTVLVHCAAGINRSVSSIVFYAMKYAMWKYADVVDYIKEKKKAFEGLSTNVCFFKQHTLINGVFARYLQRYERRRKKNFKLKAY